MTRYRKSTISSTKKSKAKPKTTSKRRTVSSKKKTTSAKIAKKEVALFKATLHNLSQRNRQN